MARNPAFTVLLEAMQAIHDKKNEDYATADNPYSNFELAGQLGAMFTEPVDIACAVLIGVKIARLAELRGKGKKPNCESIADTHLDLATYSAIWGSYDGWKRPNRGTYCERQINAKMTTCAKCLENFYFTDHAQTVCFACQSSR